MLGFSEPHKYSVTHLEQPWFVLSAARRFSVVASEDPFVSHFYGFEADSTKSLTLVIPDGCVDIFFDCNNATPSAFVYGSPLEISSVSLLKGHKYLGVRFAPGVVPGFLNISAGELVNHKYNFLEVVSDAEQLLEQLVNQESFAKQINLIKDFLLTKTNPRITSRFTLPIVNKICQEKGNVRIKNLESLTGCTVRTLQRVFLDDLGMSPKTFCQIIRSQSAVYRIQYEEVCFSDLAFELGFSDQPHFIREFKRFVNATPMDYQNCVKQEGYLNKIHFRCR